MSQGLTFTQVKTKLIVFCKKLNRRLGTSFYITANIEKDEVQLIGKNKRPILIISNVSGCTYKELDGFMDTILMEVNEQLEYLN